MFELWGVEEKECEYGRVVVEEGWGCNLVGLRWKRK